MGGSLDPVRVLGFFVELAIVFSFPRVVLLAVPEERADPMPNRGKDGRH
jgi:hypothetical protein